MSALRPPCRWLAAAGLALGLGAGAAQADCRLALALALDVSGSVNFQEYRLQVDGVANALSHPEVIQALFALPGETVAIAIYEWSGPSYQRVLQGWVELGAPADVQAVAGRLRAVDRYSSDPSTAIGAALLFGARLMREAPPCWRQVIDISGDGKSNTGPHPRDVEMPFDLMVNALAVGGELIDPGEMRHVSMAELQAYFRAYVIRGPEAFVETARGFREFEKAMIRKLKRELQVLAVSDAGDSLPHPRPALP